MDTVNDGGRVFELFDPSGTFLRSVRQPDYRSRTWNIWPDPRGGAVLMSPSIGRNLFSEAGPSRPIIRLSLGNEVAQADTVAEGWQPPRPEPEVTPPIVFRGYTPVAEPSVFEPELLFDILPDGTVVHSDSSAYRVKLRRLPPGVR